MRASGLGLIGLSKSPNRTKSISYLPFADILVVLPKPCKCCFPTKKLLKAFPGLPRRRVEKEADYGGLPCVASLRPWQPSFLCSCTSEFLQED